MVELEDEFVIRSGSQANVKAAASLAPGWQNIRLKLLEAHVLKESGDKFVFTEDAVFSSPSAAASVVLGRQVAGPVYWVDKNGSTYKAVQEGLLSP
jgi:hypothetical protein